ncbi:hypothetical protein Ciccas_009466 [Cichlidogyrus casuarinus]|uniref:Uncharacterized protein n=1 Tax=Cichlidogyrus casuarinus TaxID=1844966 RepID=A0ABD2PZR1_9PLAT
MLNNDRVRLRDHKTQSLTLEHDGSTLSMPQSTNFAKELRDKWTKKNRLSVLTYDANCSLPSDIYDPNATFSDQVDKLLEIHRGMNLKNSFNQTDLNSTFHRLNPSYQESSFSIPQAMTQSLHRMKEDSHTMIVQIFTSDETSYKSVVIDASTKSCQVCKKALEKNQWTGDLNYALLEWQLYEALGDIPDFC